MGQKYAAFDEQENVVGHYDDVDSPVPPAVKNVIKITDEEWSKCISTRGYKVSNEKLVAPPAPSVQQLLSDAQAKQNTLLTRAYDLVIQSPVSYTTQAGITNVYQADTRSIAALNAALQTFSKTLPPDFYWIALDNTKVLFTYADLQGLVESIGTSRHSLFQQLQKLKTSVRNAKNVSVVKQIVWVSP